MIQIKDTQDFISRLSHLLTATDHLIKAGVDTEDQTFQDLMSNFLEQFHVEEEAQDEKTKIVAYAIQDKLTGNMQEISGKIFYATSAQANFALGFRIEAPRSDNYKVIPVFA